MATKEVVREYKMADNELAQKADKLVGSMTRDATDFAKRKVDDSRRGEIVSQCTEFKNFPTDEELEGLVITATEEKDATNAELVEKLSNIRSMAETAYGNSGKYKTFNFGELSKLNGKELYFTAKRVARVGTLLLSELASEGLTVALLTEISTLATLLDNNLDAIGEAVEKRDIRTQERIILGNKLWRNMVKYANVGKSIFAANDEARYNDYVLTEGDDTPPSSTLPPI